MNDVADPTLPGGSVIRCKPKHRALTRSDSPVLRSRVEVRSRCPGWASDAVQKRLLEEALVDPSGSTDSHGRPNRIWNAVAGLVFVGVSSNEPVPAYNCYPSEPVTALVGLLQQRAQRSIEELLGGGTQDGSP